MKYYYRTRDRPQLPFKSTIPEKRREQLINTIKNVILYLGLLTFPDNMLLVMGILLSANEVPRIAQQFGLDSSVKVNMMSVVHATTTAVNLTRSVARAVK